MNIYQNSVIELLDLDLKADKIIRVLWISPSLEDLYAVEINDYKKMTFPFSIKYKELLSDLDEDRARIVKVDPDLRLIHQILSIWKSTKRTGTLTGISLRILFARNLKYT